jgi:hypothetical protein
LVGTLIVPRITSMLAETLQEVDGGEEDEVVDMDEAAAANSDRDYVAEEDASWAESGGLLCQGFHTVCAQARLLCWQVPCPWQVEPLPATQLLIHFASLPSLYTPNNPCTRVSQ